ncbi:MAG TPA: helix-turn-helix domain-containing protein [Actinomycetota bacterium]|nr:helix-turn-helix domain-containing protein [Actinomycetota bacterium]
MADAKNDEYLLAAQVGRVLHVSPKTVSRWAKEGKLPYVRTLGGHRRFPAAPIRELAGRLASESMSVDDILSQTPGGN